MSELKRDNVISLLRSISMIAIVLCHFLQNMFTGAINELGMFFGIGVQVFILISGVLYGNKYIESFGKWFLNRYLKITIPVYVLLITVFVFSIITGKAFNLYTFIVYGLDLQGIINFHIFDFLDIAYYKDFGHLWFLTAIMLCYLSTFLLQKIKPAIIKKTKAKIIYFLIFAVLIMFCVLFNHEAGNYLFYILLYSFGYFFGSEIIIKAKSKKFTLLAFVTAAGASLVYLGSHFVIDNTNFYTVVVSNIFKSCIACFVFIVAYYLHYNYSKAFNKIADSRANLYFDKISYYVYLLHPLFITGLMGVMHITEIFALNLMIFVALLFVSSIIMYYICKPLIKYVRIK